MLTSRVLRNGAGYSKKHLEQNDYYAEGEKITGHWFGKGAEKLGLNGQVEHEQFERVRQGLHPETGEKLRQRTGHRTRDDGSKEAQGRNLYDFTFSAPKSVSIMAILGGDERLIEAHNRAVQAALTQLERYAATRVRTNNQDTDRITGNLIVACYGHDASRRLDPQLHTHCVAANMTFDPEEERWKALQAVGIYDRSKFLTEIYRNHLVSALESFGYEVENRTDGPEIKAISQGLVQHFSQGSRERDVQVAAFTEAHGRAPTGNEIAVLVRESRPDKLINISTAEVREEQRARLTGDHKREIAAARAQAIRQPSPVKTHGAEQSLQHALDHVFERVSVAPDYEVLTEALRHGRGHVGLEELTQALRQRESRDEIIRAGDDIATRSSLNREREMIGMVNALQGRMERLGREPESFQLSPSLSQEQQHAIKFVLDSRDRAVNIQGAAGARKTTTLGELHRVLEDNGRGVWATAPTASAVGELHKVGFSLCQTVERLLLDTESHQFLRDSALIVDEAGMVSARQMHGLLRLAEKIDARLIFCGDTKQIQSVEAGDALRILEKDSRLASVALGEVKRQQNVDYKAAIMTLRNDPARGFDKLDKMGAVIESGMLDRPEAVAKAYQQARGTVLVVCPTHEEIRRVTAAIRTKLHERGELATEKKLERLEPLNWTEAQKRETANLVPGQVLVFHKGTKEARKHESFTVTKQNRETVSARNRQGKEIEITKKQAKCYGVFERREIDVAAGDWLSIQANVRDGAYQFTNGERVKVAKINESGSMKLEDGRTMPRNFQQYNHGYAITVHKSQGKTVDEVIISGDRMTKELFYVAASRGRHKIQVFTGDKSILREAIGLSGLRQSALELLRSTTRRVDRTRFAERPTTLVERVGKVLEKIWLNVPRLFLGERFAPQRDEREMGR